MRTRTRSEALKFEERPLSALDAIYVRRSVRAYAPERLDNTTISALLNAAVQAPTAMLEQPWVFAVVQDPKVLEQLAEQTKAIWRTEAGPAALLAHFAEREDGVFYGAPALVVIGARRTDPFVVADCWLAAGNLMLAACALGLGTCVIGSAVPALNAPEGKAAAGIPADVTAIAPIVIGIPSGAAATPVTRRAPEIVSWK